MVQDEAERPKMTFDLDPVTVEQVPRMVEYDEDTEVTQSPMTELMRWHQALGHVSMTKLQRMAEHGILPKRLAKCEVPMCTSCLYGKAVRRSWRNKPKKVQTGGKLRTATSPGQCVSVDQIESAAPGLIAQMKGWITTKRYRVATVFVDHYSGLSYVHFQKTTDGPETLEAKLAFETYAEKNNVRVQSYQADNGRFAEKAFVDHATSKDKRLPIVESTRISKMVWQSVAFGCFKTVLGQCCYMRNTGGQVQSIRPYGPTRYAVQTTLRMSRRISRERIESLRWNCLRVQTSGRICRIIRFSDVRFMSSMKPCKRDTSYLSGTHGHESESTSVCHLNMQGRWRSC